MKKLAITLAFALSLSAQDAFRVKVTGHGQPMILIPGLSSSGETWDTTVAHYQDRFECHVFTVAGFAGVPRIPAPMLEHARDAIAAYAIEKKLKKPVILGHSLGGFLALSIAEKYPDLPSKLVIVDAYPFLSAVYDSSITLEQAKSNAEMAKKFMSSQTQDIYEQYVKSGVGTRMMATKDSDQQRIIAWGLASDRTASADAMVEMMTTDLREDIAKIQSPALVLATWAGMKDFTDRAKTQSNLKSQYARLSGVQIELHDTARHFLMWDDPVWMFARMDAFVK